MDCFERVGGSTPVEVDVRIIGATNVDLLALTNRGLFKRDLLDRLSFEVLYLPPLRNREGDILLLADHFARRMAFELGRKETPIISNQAKALLEQHAWPGNVRELKNVVERAVYRTDAAVVMEIQFNPFLSPYAFRTENPPEEKTPAESEPVFPDFTALPFKTAVNALQRHMLNTALESSRFNQKKAAEKLGLTYDQLRGLLKKHANALQGPPT